MKKATLFAGIFLVLFSVANAQDTTAIKTQDSTTVAPAVAAPAVEAAAQPAVAAPVAVTVSGFDAMNNPAVAAIAAKYHLLPMPEAMTPEQIFPVLGDYTPSAVAAPAVDASAPATEVAATEAAPAVTNVKIILDQENKGLVWVEGLPQGKIKAALRKSPSTYKIPAQVTEDGKEVKEGTLIFDKDTKMLSVIIGKPYNDLDPAAAFAPAVEEPVAVAPKVKKGKKVKHVKPVKVEKPYTFTGSKVEVAAEPAK